MVAREDIQKLVDAIAAKFPVERIILFGSHAYGTPTEDSDVDLLVVMEYEGKNLDRSVDLMLAADIDFPLDLVLWRAAELDRRYRQFNPIAREALDHGKSFMTAEVREWLERAEADFTSAKFNLSAPTPNPGLVMFLCQQCVEKLMKGVLVRHGDVPPKTHALGSLSKRLVRFEPAWAWEERELVWLTKGAVEFRYPGMGPDASASQPAYELAERLRAALLPLISAPP